MQENSSDVQYTMEQVNEFLRKQIRQLRQQMQNLEYEMEENARAYCPDCTHCNSIS